MTFKVPFSKPDIGEEETEAVNRVLRSGWLAAGPETEAFEQEFSDYISPPGEHYYCIFTNSCTSALKIAYKYFKERGYRSVMYPKNTFCATYSAAEEIGLKTIPFPVEEGVEISSSTTVQTAVHFGGVKEDYYGILIEDSAHRIEPNDPLIGKIRCYSFYVTKNMTTGSGGMFVTNDKEIYDYARLCWRDGLSSSTADRLGGKVGYEVLAMAGGYDGNDIAAAIGRVQLKRLPEFSKRRRDIVSQYNRSLEQDWQGNHLYPYFVKTEEEVQKLIQHLKEKGIQASHHYPGTGWLGVSLPLYPLMTDEDVETVIAAVKQFVH